MQGPFVPTAQESGVIDAMEPGVGLPRNASVEELALSMFGAGAANFRLGRTPSEAEFSQFLSANGLVPPPGEGGDVQGAAYYLLPQPLPLLPAMCHGTS